jgi:putative endonuclease
MTICAKLVGEMKQGSTRAMGGRIEQGVARRLEKQGYKILDMNFAWQQGEIDIVAVDGDRLVFVEVKARRSGKYGSGIEAVTPWKLRKIARTGDYFRKIWKGKPLPVASRIDVVGVEMEGKEILKVEHLKDVTG